MSDNPTACVTFADGTTLAVETADGLVQLIARDAGGTILEGREFAPLEAHRLGHALTAAAFAARGAV